MLKRLSVIVAFFLVVALMLVGVIWYLAFFAGLNAPTRIEMSFAEARITVSWSNDGPVFVEAASLDDALIGLGYGQGRSRSWQIVLWRQAALGRLSEWFGEDALPIDRFMKQLYIAKSARQAANELSPEASSSLIKFASGIDAAISARDLARDTPFLLLGIKPEPWEPWHSIAVERLFAWIAGDPFAPGDSSSFAGADSALRELLRVHSFSYNTITSARRENSAFIAARYVTGSSAIPFFVESELQYAGASFTGITVPGTLVSPLGKTGELAWAFLLRGNAAIFTESLDPSTIQIEHDIIEFGDREELITISRSANRMPLILSTRALERGAVDVLDWSGFSVSSDFAAWLGLYAGQMATIRLMYNDGIVNNSGLWTGVGNPVATEAGPGGLEFIASRGPLHTPQNRIAHLGEGVTLSGLLSDTYSQSAADSIEQFLVMLPDSLLISDRLISAVPYLTNWNHEYAASEIGASIYESSRRGGARADSSLAEVMDDVLSEMSTRFGPDMSAWRWENVQQRVLYFPGTTGQSSDGGRPEESFTSKFAPTVIGGPGHPQTFVWGGVSSSGRLSASSAWEGGLDLSANELVFSRPQIDHRAFLGTYLSSNRPIELKVLSAVTPRHQTLLLPRAER